MTYTEYRGQIVNKKYSSFKQSKGGIYKEWIDAILEKDFKPPINAVVDLTDSCNLNCYWCNAQSFRSKDYLDTKHVKTIIDLVSDWGVKSICLAGAGEPTLHPDFNDIISYSGEKRLQVEISSNGVLLDKDTRKSLINCGSKKSPPIASISIDAGSKETWEKLKSSKGWNKVINNISKLCEEDREDIVDKTYKVLLVPDNQHELYRGGKLAKSIGMNNFYVRPAGFSNVDGVEKKGEFNKNVIMNQFNKLKELEDDDFTVYKLFGRTDEKFGMKHRFDKCKGTPLLSLFCADGWVYPCIVRREEEKLRMCKHLNIRDYWNSKEHHKLIDSIDLDECPLCPASKHNEFIQAYKLDYMFKWFP